ncbi:MAG: hypothetical protein KGI57_06330 [Hyphomicrobiales bacterium]|nr:hypothetical protein [Hyphomicrobiales bacterium]
MKTRSYRAVCAHARLVTIAALVFAAAAAQGADTGKGAGMDMGMDMSKGAAPATGAAPAPDPRQPVKYPPALRAETLATMRGHLQGLADIQVALADGRFDDAARIATDKLGMSSMKGGQGMEEARYMPPPMQALGLQLHTLAGEFASAAQDAGATGDVKKPQALLGRMMQTCVSCHAVYRLE